MSTAELDLPRCSMEVQTPDLERLCASRAVPPRLPYFRWKRLLDTAAALVLLVPGLPLIGLLVVLVRITSRGPGIYRQRRVGRGGRVFTIYKIRTMHADAENDEGAQWSRPGDPRITRVGRVLRKVHLDELPQLFNVLLGQMSLVGPRPERPEFVWVLADQIPGYADRLAILPGVTGLAQINLPPDTDLASVRRKQVLDLEYARTANFWLDLRMMACTSLRIIGISGAHAIRLARVQRIVRLPDDQFDEHGRLIGNGHPRAGMTPAALHSEALRKALVKYGDTLPADQAQLRDQVTQLLHGEPGVRSQESGVSEESVVSCQLSVVNEESVVSEDLGVRGQKAGVRVGVLTQGRPATSNYQLATTPPGIFTVDVEDYFHVTAFEEHISRDSWDDFAARVVPNTQRILDLLARHHVHGTFFVLGWVAKRYPDLVRQIHAAGHEIGSHGMWHRRIYHQTPDEFRRNVQESRDLLTDIIGERVTAYRAPTFSITEDSLWAWEILAKEGFEVDCSVFPIHHDRYGIPGAEPAAHRITTRAGLLWEVPSTTRRLARFNIPVSGGGYFRLMPLWWTRRHLRAAHRASGRPFIFYVHPWELDPGQPRLKVGTRLSRARHYVNLASTERKVDRLLRHFRFGRLDHAVSRLGPHENCPLGDAPIHPLPLAASPSPNGKGRKSPMAFHPACAQCPHYRSNGQPACQAPVFQVRS